MARSSIIQSLFRRGCGSLERWQCSHWNARALPFKKALGSRWKNIQIYICCIATQRPRMDQNLHQHRVWCTQEWPKEKLGTNKCPWQIRRGDAYRHYFAAKLGNARSRTSPPSCPEWVQCGDHIESPVNSGHLVLGSSPHKVAGREIWRKMFWPLATLPSRHRACSGLEPTWTAPGT